MVAQELYRSRLQHRAFTVPRRHFFPVEEAPRGGERGGKERKLRMRTEEREIQKLKVLKTYFVKLVKIKKI